jgi:hypothetical protein
MTSLVDAHEMGDRYARTQGNVAAAIGSESLAHARLLKLRERAALIANKPERAYSSKDGYYDPRAPWSFHRKDKVLLVDEPLREFHARLAHIDAILAFKTT